MHDVEAGTRRRILRSGLVAAGAAVAGGVLLERRPEPAEGQGGSDTEVLNLALLLEYVQAGFYEAALERGALSGELREYARAAARHEREHIDLLREALGSRARSEPRLDFGEDVADAERFGAAAVRLEDLATQAYNAGAPSLSADALLAAGRIVSVHARHSAWVRDLTGEDPAPEAAEPERSVSEVTQALDELGWVR
jgi:hypothetical protein